MLERLRMKRNSSKSQAGGADGGKSNKDTRPADAFRRGASSSRSNSTGKDAEPAQDPAAGQQPSPHLANKTDSGEGVESLSAPGAAATRRSAATVTSAATASPLPGANHFQHQSQQDQPHSHPPPQQQNTLHRRPQQAALSPWLGEPRESPSVGPSTAGPRMEPPRGGQVDEQEILQRFLSQEAALLSPRRNPLMASGVGGALHLSAHAPAAAASGHGARLPDLDCDPRDGGGGGKVPLYCDAPYGLSAGLSDGAGGAMHLRGLREAPTAAAAASIPADILPRRPQPPVAPSQLEHLQHRRDMGEISVELAGGAREESLLLQRAMARAQQGAQSHLDAAGVRRGAGAGGPPARVLDLAQPARALAPVLNLSRGVDLSLELQLQDIYREEPPRLRLVWRLGNL